MINYKKWYMYSEETRGVS